MICNSNTQSFIMKSPVKIILPEKHVEHPGKEQHSSADNDNRLNFANTAFFESDHVALVKQTVNGTDHVLEVWNITVSKADGFTVVAERSFIAMALFFKGTLRIELTGYGELFTIAKNFSLLYVAAGTHTLYLQAGDFLLLYFTPPLHDLEGMRKEHSAIAELLQRHGEDSKHGIVLPLFPLPKDAWIRLKLLEEQSNNLYELDLPLRQYIIGLLHHYNLLLRRNKQRKKAPTSVEDKAVEVRAYLLSNLSNKEATGLKELTNQFYIGSRSLTKAFKHLTGLTIPAFVLEKRLAYSKHLLETSKKPLMEIAIAAGFGDASHFIKKFKKKFGYTPRKHRAAR
jgi:AraC-like DNA-binding protein